MGHIILIIGLVEILKIDRIPTSKNGFNGNSINTITVNYGYGPMSWILQYRICMKNTNFNKIFILKGHKYSYSFFLVEYLGGLFNIFTFSYCFKKLSITMVLKLW